MKRIYVSFFTTVTVAVVMTLIAFLTRDEATGTVIREKNTQLSQKDSAYSGVKSGAVNFN